MTPAIAIESLAALAILLALYLRDRRRKVRTIRVKPIDPALTDRGLHVIDVSDIYLTAVVRTANKTRRDHA